jgi:hypothetical protein
MTLPELRARCVAEFPRSTSRGIIMASLEAVIRRLVDTKVEGELWIDGSFLTEKIDPGDVDLLLRIKAEFFDNATPEQEQTLEWLEKGLKNSFRCDSYIWREYPPGHALYHVSEDDRIYWTDWFGRSRSGHPKGIAVLAIPQGVV